MADACRERDSIQIELMNIVQEKEELKKRSEELSYKLLDLERQLDNGTFWSTYPLYLSFYFPFQNKKKYKDD